jgi:RNA polymerase-binding transcription factor DksA
MDTQQRSVLRVKFEAILSVKEERLQNLYQSIARIDEQRDEPTDKEEWSALLQDRRNFRKELVQVRDTGIPDVRSILRKLEEGWDGTCTAPGCEDSVVHRLTLGYITTLCRECAQQAESIKAPPHVLQVAPA